jgi:predicted CoA-binding protein
MDRHSIPTVLGDDTIRELLQTARVIAGVGLSDDPARPSYGVARYLQQQGYRIIPVNPEITEVLGERSYPNLASVPEQVDIVNLFRRSAFVGGHIDEVIDKGARLVWMQLGVRDEAAAQRARAAGIPVVISRCLAVEHGRLLERSH